MKKNKSITELLQKMGNDNAELLLAGKAPKMIVCNPGKNAEEKETRTLAEYRLDDLKILLESTTKRMLGNDIVVGSQQWVSLDLWTYRIKKAIQEKA